MNTPMHDQALTKRDKMSKEVCDFAHLLLRRGDCPLLVVEALIAGTIAFAGRIGEEAMRSYMIEVKEISRIDRENSIPF